MKDKMRNEKQEIKKIQLLCRFGFADIYGTSRAELKARCPFSSRESIVTKLARMVFHNYRPRNKIQENSDETNAIFIRQAEASCC